MKILILDDQETRHVYFKEAFKSHTLSHVYTSNECIDKLSEEEFDCVTLDHDLGRLEMVESGENTGYAVAKWLYENPDKQPNIIRLHSLNPVGRKNMKFLLPNAIEQPCYY